MSFFELDGGNVKKAKPKAKKSTKSKAKKSTKSKAKKAPAKKSSGKKKTKKGGNFLGTVSELFAPAGWESFVTAAGLLALDRTDNFLRKSKDSKKQKGGADDTPKMEEEMTGGARKRSSSRKHRGGADDTPKMEEEMTGGARKRSSSRKQRGGSDGHHTIEALDAMMGSEEPEMTGGAKKKKGSVKRKQKGGEFMNDNQKQQFLELYNKTNNERPNNNKSQNSDRRIQAILEQVGVGINPNIIGEMDAAINEARQLIKNRNFNQSLKQQANAQQANAQQASAQQAKVVQSNNSLQFPMSPMASNPVSNSNSLFNDNTTGGKPKSKSKPKTTKKAPKRK